MSSTKNWDNKVLILSTGGYIPLAIGGWSHPEEVNRLHTLHGSSSR